MLTISLQSIYDKQSKNRRKTILIPPFQINPRAFFVYHLFHTMETGDFVFRSRNRTNVGGITSKTMNILT